MKAASWIFIALIALTAVFYGFFKSSSDADIVKYLDAHAAGLTALAVEVRNVASPGRNSLDSDYLATLSNVVALQDMRQQLSLESINVWQDQGCVAFVYSNSGLIFVGSSKSLAYCEGSSPNGSIVQMDRPYSLQRAKQSGSNTSVAIQIKEHRDWYLHRIS